MKLKTMDIQKFLLTGWYPKMAYNVSAAWRGCGRLKTEHANTKLTLN